MCVAAPKNGRVTVVCPPGGSTHRCSPTRKAFFLGGLHPLMQAPLVEVVAELAATARMAQAAHGASLDLADALAGESEALADFL